MTDYDEGFIWDAASGKLIAVFSEHHNSIINSIAFSPDGLQVLTASSDGTARISDVETGSAIAVLERQDLAEGSRPQVGVAKFSPDGKYVLTVDRNGLCIWDAASGRMLQRGNELLEEIVGSQHHWSFSLDWPFEELTRCSLLNRVDGN